MSHARIYAVFEDGKPFALVRARTQAEAYRYVAAARFEVQVPDPDALITFTKAGLVVKDAFAAADTTAALPFEG